MDQDSGSFGKETGLEVIVLGSSPILFTVRVQNRGLDDWSLDPVRSKVVCPCVSMRNLI